MSTAAACLPALQGRRPSTPRAVPQHAVAQCEPVVGVAFDEARQVEAAHLIDALDHFVEPCLAQSWLCRHRLGGTDVGVSPLTNAYASLSHTTRPSAALMRQGCCAAMNP